MQGGYRIDDGLDSLGRNRREGVGDFELETELGTDDTTRHDHDDIPNFDIYIYTSEDGLPAGGNGLGAVGNGMQGCMAYSVAAVLAELKMPEALFSMWLDAIYPGGGALFYFGRDSTP